MSFPGFLLCHKYTRFIKYTLLYQHLMKCFKVELVPSEMLLCITISYLGYCWLSGLKPAWLFSCIHSYATRSCAAFSHLILQNALCCCLAIGSLTTCFSSKHLIKWRQSAHSLRCPFCLPPGRPPDQEGSYGQARPVCRQPGDRLRRSSDSARRILTLRASKDTAFIFCTTWPPDSRLPPLPPTPNSWRSVLNKMTVFCSMHRTIIYFFFCLNVFHRTRTRAR